MTTTMLKTVLRVHNQKSHHINALSTSTIEDLQVNMIGVTLKHQLHKQAWRDYNVNSFTISTYQKNCKKSRQICNYYY